MIVTFLGALTMLSCAGFVLGLQAREKDQKGRIKVTLLALIVTTFTWALFIPTAIRIQQLEMLLLEKEFLAGRKFADPK